MSAPNKQRLDQVLVKRGLVPTRSQAASYIKLGQVYVNNQLVSKAGALVSNQDIIKLTVAEQYVSRAAMKLASVADTLNLNFQNKVILDVGSSTGGFTDFALRHGAKKVVAVDVGTEQLHPSLRQDPRIELHEKTDIRDFKPASLKADIILVDVSFISVRQIVPELVKFMNQQSILVAMAKPQFETLGDAQKHRGVIKNELLRRNILKDFESWVQKLFVIVDKADSEVAGEKGNRERFYALKPLAKTL